MNHHHNHDHKHEKKLSFKEKLSSLLKHWIDHNSSHKENYLTWAEKAKMDNLSDIASCLEQAGELSDKINLQFEKALKDLF
jgi:rubrerythrin